MPVILPQSWLYGKRGSHAPAQTVEAMEKTKATFNLTEAAKQRLEALKARLRKESDLERSQANESAIVDCLIRAADFDTVLADLRRRR